MLKRIFKLEKRKGTGKVKAYRVIWPAADLYTGIVGEVPGDMVTVIAPENLKGQRMRQAEFLEKYPDGIVEQIIIERKEKNA